MRNSRLARILLRKFRELSGAGLASVREAAAREKSAYKETPGQYSAYQRKSIDFLPGQGSVIDFKFVQSLKAKTKGTSD
jgi:hypothetical protein